MSFNVRNANASLKTAQHPVAADYWWATARGPAAVQYIKDVDPDVIGFQEMARKIQKASGKQIDIFKKKLPAYTYLFANEVTPIAYKTSRFKLLDSGRIAMQYTTDRDSDSNRTASWMKLRDNKTKQELFFINIHANNGYSKLLTQGRSRGYDRLLKAWKKINPDNKLPAILVGDFNAGSNETKAPYNDHKTKFTAAGWTDVSEEGSNDEQLVKGVGSANNWGKGINGKYYYKAIRLGRRIDYIWISGEAEAESWMVYTGRKVTWKQVDGRRVAFAQGIIPSDHWPVVSNIKLTG